jgi:hypothetical protein
MLVIYEKKVWSLRMTPPAFKCLKDKKSNRYVRIVEFITSCRKAEKSISLNDLEDYFFGHKD